jgi:hypothetical protein
MAQECYDFHSPDGQSMSASMSTDGQSIIHLYVFLNSEDNIFHVGTKFTHFGGKVGYLTFCQAPINLTLTDRECFWDPQFKKNCYKVQFRIVFWNQCTNESYRSWIFDSIYTARFTNAIMDILLYNLKLKILKFLLNLITNKILIFLG